MLEYAEEIFAASYLEFRRPRVVVAYLLLGWIAAVSCIPCVAHDQLRNGPIGPQRFPQCVKQSAASMSKCYAHGFTKPDWGKIRPVWYFKSRSC